MAGWKAFADNDLALQKQMNREAEHGAAPHPENENGRRRTAGLRRTIHFSPGRKARDFARDAAFYVADAKTRREGLPKRPLSAPLGVEAVQ